MRRPEVKGFSSIAPPADMYDFTLLAPYPSSSIIVDGAEDGVVTGASVQKPVDKLKTQRRITIDHEIIPQANHFLEHEMTELKAVVDA